MRKKELEKENKQLRNLTAIQKTDIEKLEVEIKQTRDAYDSLERDYASLLGNISNLKHKLKVLTRVNDSYKGSIFYRLFKFFNKNKWR